MRDLACKLNLFQVVTEPTRISGDSSSLIDHAYLSDSSILQSCHTIPPLCSSDHNCLLVNLNRLIPPPVKYKQTLWFYQRADFASASEELQNFTCDNTLLDINSAWSNWKHSFLSVMAKYVPHRNVKVKKCLPWLSHTLLCLFKNCDCIERPSPSTLLPPASPLEQPRTRQ